MTGPASSSAALPIAYVVLRVLIVLNWLMAVAIVVLLAAFPTRQWIMTSLHLSPSPGADRVVWGMRAIAVLGVAVTPLNYIFLRQLLDIVQTVRAGDPFIAENAMRLQ